MTASASNREESHGIRFQRQARRGGGGEPRHRPIDRARLRAGGRRRLDLRTRGELAAHGHPAHAATCDLGEASAVARYIEDAAATLGGIDVLVNNASAF